MSKLYIVPTPIGNLEDMTMRAIKVLQEVDCILAEDTRTSGILMKHFDIKTRMQSHHKFNEHKTVEAVVERLRAGETIALVSERRLYPIPVFCWCVRAVRQEYLLSVCPGRQLLYRLLSIQDCRATGLRSKVFFLRKKVGQLVWGNCRLSLGQ